MIESSLSAAKLNPSPLLQATSEHGSEPVRAASLNGILHNDSSKLAIFLAILVRKVALRI